jgi:hypothetical protein
VTGNAASGTSQTAATTSSPRVLLEPWIAAPNRGAPSTTSALAWPFISPTAAAGRSDRRAWTVARTAAKGNPDAMPSAHVATAAAAMPDGRASAAVAAAETSRLSTTICPVRSGRRRAR